MKNKYNTKSGFYAKNENSGITLITLVITIIVLLILASVATYSGIEAINNTKYTKFKAELKIMQTHVNQWYEDLKSSNSEEFSNNIKSKFEGVGAINNDAKAKSTLTTIGVTDEQEQSKYYLLKKEQKEALKVEGVEQDVLVNVLDRKVVSYLGCKFQNTMYYRLEDTDFYNVNYIALAGKPEHFNVRYENLKQGLTKVTIYDVDYDGYNTKWRVNYKKADANSYSKSEDLSFNVTEDGNYNVQLENQNGDIIGDIETIFASVIRTTNSTLSGETDKEKMTSKNPVIPKGFKAVNINSNATNFEGDSAATWAYTDSDKTEVAGWNNGLVIEDEDGNQFVWVPCTTGTSSDVVTYSKNFNYPSNYSASETNTSDAQDTTTVDGAKYSAIPVRENEQINNYGGFYVARFEAGIPTTTLTHSVEENNVYDYVLVSQEGAKVWNYIDYTHSYVAAEKMINNTTKYGNNKSGLITGTQWDTVMKWYEKNNIKVGGTQVTGTQDWGTYKNLPYNLKGLYFSRDGSTNSNWIDGEISYVGSTNPFYYHASGLNNNGYKKNIADLGGNLWEYTSEIANNSKIVLRGGCANWTTTDRQASYRSSDVKTINTSAYLRGLRVALYIQDWLDLEENNYYIVEDNTKSNYLGKKNVGTIEDFRDLVNAGNFNYDTAYVTENIYIDGTESNQWTPIGTSSNPFNKTFDAQNYTIDGVYIKNSSGRQGLFGTNNGTIKKIKANNFYIDTSSGTGGNNGGIVGSNEGGIIEKCTINNSEIRGNASNIGGIAGKNYTSSTISNCINKAKVYSTGDTSTGGIVGWNYNGAKVNNCENYGKIEGKKYTAGIVGCNQLNSQIKNCTNYNDITGDDQSGGISGINYDSSIVDGCVNEGIVTSAITVSNGGTDYFCRIGGIAGQSYRSYISNSHNNGKVVGNYLQIGGICGIVSGKMSGKNFEIENCYNTGNIENADNGGHQVGGIVGYMYESSMSKCYNTNKVSGTNNVGGIVGLLGYNGVLSTVENCYNKGDVYAINSYCGGVAGNGTCGKILNCYNTGNISNNNTTQYIGAIMAIGASPATGQEVKNCYYLTGTCTGGINGADVTGQAEAKSSNDMKASTFVTLLNGTQNVWQQDTSNVNGGYPIFK